MPTINDFKSIKVHLGSVDQRNARELVVGRAGLVRSLWAHLDGSSVRLLSERRMGKTWVLRLALALRPEWALPLFLDVQGIGSAAEFVLRVNRTLHENDLITEAWWNKVADWFRRLGVRLQGQKVGALSIPSADPWSALLEDTCRHFVARAGDRRAILMVDELPFFLDKLIKSDQETEAIQLLDTLRSLRHDLPSLRMVLCGSLGLHIVLDKLQQNGYSGQPVNDMPPFEVPPLASEDARYLSGCLLLGEKVPCSDRAEVARAIACASSGVPFYIQHIVDWMARSKDQTWTPEKAGTVPATLFEASGDPASFSYYDNRLAEFYPDDVVEKARAVLDVLSRESEGLCFEKLVNLVRHRPKTLTVDNEQVLKILHVLRDDHYLVAEGDRWRFKLEIVRQWCFSIRGRLAL